ncbi:surfeit locus protein 1 isoform X3 [Lampetra fluviatilis]
MSTLMLMWRSQSCRVTVTRAYRRGPPLPHRCDPLPRVHVAPRRRLSSSAGGAAPPLAAEEGERGLKWLLLLIPTAAFALGTWQVQRRKWKLSLIADLEARTRSDPVTLPLDVEELRRLEYRRVRVRGEFDHSQELYLLPRSFIQQGRGPGTAGGLVAGPGSGAHVVTPLRCSELGVTILVDRGFVPMSKLDPAKRPEGQVEGEVELVGVVRMDEPRCQFTPDNDPAHNRWYHRDVGAMAHATGVQPVLIDADASSTVRGGPIGGQTQVVLRNEHMQYLLTWYSLSAATAAMWYIKFMRRG